VEQNFDEDERKMRLRDTVGRLFDIREGEGQKASLMFAYIFLVIASLLIIKPVRNSLFLTRFGVSQLPYAFILVAIFAAVATKFYSKYSQRVRLNRLIFYTTLISMGGLLFFWFFLHFGYQAGWYIYALYIWVAIFGVITTSQFWLLANYVFNAREAKRLFGFVGAGAISGGIFGGYLTKFLAPVVGTDNLIFLSIAFLSGCLLILTKVWRENAQATYLEKMRRQRRSRRGAESDGSWRTILASRHVALLASIVGAGVIVASLVDYQFSAIASEIFTNEDQLTAFFGFWLSNLSIASLIIQLFLTGRVIRRFGVVTSLFLLPLGILVGAVATFVNPALWSAVLVKVSDGGFKQSVNKAGLVLLALPIPAAIRSQAKAFVDVFVDSLATGVSGVLLILFTQRLGFSTQHISLMMAGFIALWIYLIVSVKGDYINSFRVALEKGSIDLDEQTVNIQDASVVAAFEKALAGDNERQILYVLHLIENVKNEQFIPQLKQLMRHPSADIRLQALRLLAQFSSPDLTQDIGPLIQDDDQDVRVEALCYITQRADDKVKVWRDHFASPSLKVRGSALLCAAREHRADAAIHKAIDLRGRLSELMELAAQPDCSQGEKRFIKSTISKVVRLAGDPELFEFLSDLLDDQDLAVVQEAIVSAGQTGSERFIPALIQHLNTHQVRKYAREALAAYDEDIIETLGRYLTDPQVERRIRMAIPKVFALIGFQRSVDLLIDNLDHKNLALRYEMIRALNKLRMDFPLLKFPVTPIERRVHQETENYLKTLAILGGERALVSAGEATANGAVSDDQVGRARELLIRTLKDRMERGLERIFRLMGLKYPPRDIYNAYQGITSGKTALRANAIEFLDNILDTRLKRAILPIVEGRYSTTSAGEAQIRYDFTSESERLEALLEVDDNWLKTCALYAIAAIGETKPLWLIRKYTNNADPMVKETAEYALKRLQSRDA
jgi:AAA family ATP:ADP antiporter